MQSADRDMPEIRIVGFAGSLRPESVTRMAVQYALRGAEEVNAKATFLDLSSYNLPFCGQENESGNINRVERFRADLRSSDGIILGSPEIHGSFSGVIKNALDLAGAEEFEGKMLGLIGVAGGRMGAAETLSQLRMVGRSLHAWVVPDQVSIADSSEAFDLEGNPTDVQIGRRLKIVGQQVAHFALLHKCENHMQFLKEWESTPISYGDNISDTSLETRVAPHQTTTRQ